ncbi:MAG TPA: DPP IV N-terminal domain-containing protein [Anaeromyxobacteraceae bacterium]|nr:DPP IV N-terminal domain-containing protein [Anaeromyxobacteraceae bacterium]
MRTLVILALALTAPSLASAQRQYIDVGKPDFRPLALAIAPFASGPGASADALDVQQTMRDDLALTGTFDLLDPRSFLADPSEGTQASSIKFPRWSDVGAEGLVKAAVKREGSLVAGELHLYDVRAGREVLYRVHRERSARALAHAFADDVLQFYTREPGVFRTRIAGIRKGRGAWEIVLMDVDGKGQEVLRRETAIAMLPSWRPDGGEVLVTSYRGGKPEIWAFRVPDGTPRLVVSLGDLASGGVYSPDGRSIAFTASVDGNSDVYVASADGTGIRRLTTDPATDTSPTWSPDGKRIAFVSTRSGNPHIYVMNADGTGQRRLTFKGNYNQTPRWSPRGDSIAFTARDERRVFDVFLVSPETGAVSRVTQDQGPTNEEPSWAPNGRLLVLATDRSGRQQLVVANPTGDRQKVVTSDPAGISSPAWGPLPQ